MGDRFKALTKIVLALLVLFLVAKPTFSQEKQLNIYFFWGEGCPHCAKEKPFLEKLEEEYSQVKVYNFEVWHSDKNRKLLIEVGERLNIDISGVPLTVIGNKGFIGFSEYLIAGQIKDRVQYCSGNSCPDAVAEIVGLAAAKTAAPLAPPSESEKKLIPEKIKNLSLPALTIVLGALDGFNPCAMWTLLFLISLLLGMRDRKRMWILGTTFIVASALVYFLFMAAWLNLLLFVGFIVWVRILVGLVALAGGAYNLKEYLTNKESTCRVTGGEKKQAVFAKLKQITQRRQLLLAGVGIILLAFAVNLVELICSAGLPVVFTQILTLSNLARWQYYAYMLLYIFIFMLDDLFVFVTAMVTLEITGLSTKYSRWSHLIGGILMVVIGFLLLFKPELLMFG